MKALIISLVFIDTALIGIRHNVINAVFCYLSGGREITISKSILRII